MDSQNGNVQTTNLVIDLRLAYQIGIGATSIQQARELAEAYGSQVIKTLSANQSSPLFFKPSSECEHSECYSLIACYCTAFPLHHRPLVLRDHDARARNSPERCLRGRTKREALALDLDLSYVAIRLSSGEDENGDPIVNLEQWPFILPDKLVALQQLVFFEPVCVLIPLGCVSKGSLIQYLFHMRFNHCRMGATWST